MPGDAFETGVAKKAIKTVRLSREAVITLFGEIEERVTELPMHQDSVASLDDEIANAKTEIAKVRSRNEVFVQALLEHDEAVEETEGFKLDQKEVRESIKALEHVIKTCKKNLIDAGIALGQPKVEHVANEDLAALILEMKSTSGANADAIKALSEASADASKANANAIKSLVKSTADNVKLSNATNS